MDKPQAMNIAVLQACFEYDAIDSDDENDVEESDSDSMSIITDPGKSLTPHNAKPSKCVSKAIKVFQVPEASAEKPWPAIHEDLVSESLLDIELPILMDSSNLFLTHAYRSSDSALVEVDPMLAKLSGDSSEIELPTSLLQTKDVLDISEELSPALSVDSPKLEFDNEFQLGSSQFLETGLDRMGASGVYLMSTRELHEGYEHCALPASEDNIMACPHECQAMVTLGPIGKIGDSEYTMHVDSSSESNIMVLQLIKDLAHPVDASVGEIESPHNFFISHLDSGYPPKEKAMACQPK